MPTEQPTATDDRRDGAGESSPAADAPEGWIMTLTPDEFEALLAGYAAAEDSDPDSPLAGFLQAWVAIERGKQSLMELFR